MNTPTTQAANFRPASKPSMMSEAESQAWRAELMGWAADILPAYQQFAHELPNPCTVVEIGSAHGRSAIFLAQELLKLGHGSHSKIYMVDDWGGGWFAECLPSLVKHATARELELLRPLRTRSEDACQLFMWGERATLDMVFIDGDHSRVGCAQDLRCWHDRLHADAIFAGHDYDESAHPGVVQAVDAYARSNGIEIQRPTRSVWRLR